MDEQVSSGCTKYVAVPDFVSKGLPAYNMEENAQSEGRWMQTLPAATLVY